MNLANKILANCLVVDQNEFIPTGNKYHDDKYLTQLLSSEVHFVIRESNKDLDAAGEMLAEFIEEDIAHVCNKKQVLGILDKLDFREFVEPYLKNANWESE